MNILLLIIIFFLIIVLVPVLTLTSWIVSKISEVRKLFTQKGTEGTSRTSASGSPNPKKGKIIPKDEGEYVDFEEIP